MKKKKLLILLLVIMRLAYAQSPSNPEGIWQGSLHAGRDLRAVFHFSRDPQGQWVGSFDSPDQFVSGIACSDIKFENDSVKLAIPSANARFLGKFLTDSVIEGAWIQGVKLNLVLRKTDKAIEIPRRRQTPEPPFPYLADSVEYSSKITGLRYGGTLTRPRGQAPLPAILLITGSGAQDRDESIMGHKPFAVLADFLTRNGFVVLRVDDRGVGRSTGDFAQSTSADFAQDVNASLDFLRSQPGIDQKHIGLMGHSEGGMIAPMVAAKRKDIDFIVLLAGPGEKIGSLMQGQNAAILLSSGIKKEAVEEFRAFFPQIVEAVVSAPSEEAANRNLSKAFTEWRKTANKNYVLATTGVYSDSTQENYVRAMVKSMYTPWFLYFLRYDPAPNLQDLHCKVLALNGSKDLQVVPGPNLEGIRQALQKSASPHYDVQELPGLNHLFQHCKSCTVQEYAQLEETFSPEAMALIADWLTKYGK